MFIVDRRFRRFALIVRAILIIDGLLCSTKSIRQSIRPDHFYEVDERIYFEPEVSLSKYQYGDR